MISFVMPAKNASLYVGQAVGSLCKADYKDWELIVIDDHSTDGTCDILKQAEETDSRIKVFKNRGNGKVVGLNYGYTLTSGEIIKCIDADDVLDAHFFDHIGTMQESDATCHDFYITTNDLKIIGHYSVNKTFLQKDFIYCLKYLKGVPRCVWSFTRKIGDRIFPIPEELPFEDVWFSLVIKKYAPNISYINRKLYHYRQHGNQTFGGVLNFDDKIVAFRARRMLKMAEVICSNSTNQLMHEQADNNIFKDAVCYFEFLARDNIELHDVLISDIPLEFKLKLLIYKKLKFLAMPIMKIKWMYDKLHP